MPHNSGKERQEISLVGRILSLETMLLMMGVASLIYGIVNGVETSIICGIVIIPGVFILMKVRRKDWQKHWHDPEAEQKARSGHKTPLRTRHRRSDRMKHGAIVLASASPRRTELMTLAGIEFTVVAADICEDILPGEKPSEHVIRLSRGKADAVARTTAGRFFIGADTVVVLDDAIMGKPADDADALRMLTALSGRNHKVITGFTVFDKVSGIHLSRSVHTEVTFRNLKEKEIRDYVDSGCPRDKAGAYAIQGGAVHFVRSICGSYSNVVGLPMAELYEVLQTVGALP